jgi:starvation-inducible DNA-binding protein
MQTHRQSDHNGRRTVEGSQPLLGQRAPEIQSYGTVAHYPLALDAQVRAASVEVLNQILADTMVLRDLYKKHHWQVAGHTFY